MQKTGSALRITKWLAGILLCTTLHGQTPQLTVSDTRDWWDVLRYDLQITPDYHKQYLTGICQVTFKIIRRGRFMRIDLHSPMAITSMILQGKSVQYSRGEDINTYILDTDNILQYDTLATLSIVFKGHPVIATKPPFNSGWIWAKDNKKRPWMSVTCEGSGAGIWFPCKNTNDDEPDSGATLSVTVPDSLVAVANGRLISKSQYNNNSTTYLWQVVSPINLYNIIPYIGKYVNIHTKYNGKKGALDCDLWFLDYNIPKARKLKKQVFSMLQCFEDWAGPYPFYEDGYKLVESPHPGMEHQSAIAYGNKFSKGFLGRDISGTGVGLQWDFILIHESAHEWFGNNISSNTWVHEGFARYMETLYTTCLLGAEAGNRYAAGVKKNILNKMPVISGSTSDTYNKAGTMLHMIRQITGDSLFKKILRELNQRFYHQVVTSRQIESFISEIAKQDFSSFFDQYLRTIKIPVLEYLSEPGTIKYRWNNVVNGFHMPIKVKLGDQYTLLVPTEQWQSYSVANEGISHLIVDTAYLITCQQVNPATNP